MEKSPVQTKIATLVSFSSLPHQCQPAPRLCLPISYNYPSEINCPYLLYIAYAYRLLISLALVKHLKTKGDNNNHQTK